MEHVDPVFDRLFEIAFKEELRDDPRGISRALADDAVSLAEAAYRARAGAVERLFGVPGGFRPAESDAGGEVGRSPGPPPPVAEEEL